MMSTSSLFHPLQLGPLQLPNRIVMAPMTRSRSSQPGDVPNDLTVSYTHLTLPTNREV